MNRLKENLKGVAGMIIIILFFFSIVYGYGFFGIIGAIASPLLFFGVLIIIFKIPFMIKIIKLKQITKNINTLAEIKNKTPEQEEEAQKNAREFSEITKTMKIKYK